MANPATSPSLDGYLSFPHKNAFGGFNFSFTAPPDNPFPGTLVRVTMQFRTSLLDETLASVIDTISSADADEIVITSDTTLLWTGTVKKQMLDKLDIGNWYWAIEFEDSVGNIDPLGIGKVEVTPRPVIPLT